MYVNIDKCLIRVSQIPMQEKLLKCTETFHNHNIAPILLNLHEDVSFGPFIKRSTFFKFETPALANLGYQSL